MRRAKAALSPGLRWARVVNGGVEDFGGSPNGGRGSFAASAYLDSSVKGSEIFGWGPEDFG